MPYVLGIIFQIQTCHHTFYRFRIWCFYPQLLRYTRACSRYEYFNLRAKRLSIKLKIRNTYRNTLYCQSGHFTVNAGIFPNNIKSLSLLLKYSDPRAVTVTSQLMGHFTDCMTLIPTSTFTELNVVSMRICNGFGMPAGNTCPYGPLDPYILGLAFSTILCLMGS